MEPLIAQLKALPEKWGALETRVQRLSLLAGAAIVALAVVVGASLAGDDQHFEYVFTKLAPEDLTAATAVLTSANIPFRTEAAGEAILVPSTRVHDARLILAAQGLPRAAGVGFELFDKSDLGVSAFTQKVNLQRAVEGELSRTIASLDEVKSARVHVTMPKRGLFRDDALEAQASVVLHLFPGRGLGDRQVKGVRHLVAAAVPGLSPESVTVVDGSGNVLANDDPTTADLQSLTLKTERELESRIIAVLEPAVGASAVVAKVTADFDQARIETEEQLVDADNPALRTEQRRADVRNGVNGADGVVGAAGNDPTSPGGTAKPGSGVLSSEEAKNYDFSTTHTKKLIIAPRLRRLSVAVVVNEGETPIAPETLAALSSLAKGAIGFDADRGDQIVIQSSKFRFLPGVTVESEEPAVSLINRVPAWAFAMGGFGVLAVAGAGYVMMRRRREETNEEEKALAVLTAGGRVADLEQAFEVQLPAALPAPPEHSDTNDTERTLVDRARLLSNTEPVRAALLIRAWLETDDNRSREGAANA